jgi:hypothetical protein
MLKQHHAEENANGEEQRENRLRPSTLRTALPNSPTEQEVLDKPAFVSAIERERVSPKTEGISERAKQKVKPQSKQSKPMRYSEKGASGKANLWQELISDNPMLQKETLLGRRALELQTPTKRFFKRLWPLLFLGSIYLCIYVFIINVYNQSFYNFDHRFDPITGYYNVNYYNGKDDYLLSQYGNAENYARSMSSGAGGVGYSLLLILQFFVVAIGIPATAITKITAERERMNWDALLLSRLTPLQVMVGKVVPVLKMLGRTMLALLPAIAITSFMVLKQQRSSDLSLRGVILTQACIVMTALMNIAIALYYSLTEKQSAKAALATGRWFAIPTLGAGAITGILYTLVYLVQTASGVRYPETPAGLIPFLWSPNLINPALAIVETFYPGHRFDNGVPSNMSMQMGGDFAWWCMYLTWLLLPFLYPLGCALVIRNLYKKMMRKFQDAPKDASG